MWANVEVERVFDGKEEYISDHLPVLVSVELLSGDVEVRRKLPNWCHYEKFMIETIEQVENGCEGAQ